MEMVVTFPGGKRVDAAFEGFTVRTDQSKENGGEGAEPEPFQLFLASLVTCAGIYVLGFCQKRDIPTDGISLVQRTEKNNETKRYDNISIEIRLPSDFPDRYVDAVINSANLCAVKKHIMTPPSFEITAVKG
ncbi:MAG: OsmC family protein [Spirochaetes bacterium]|nr:OsmC family protein [Spirochaetota bacterium]